MKPLKPYKLTLTALILFISSIYCYANEIEEKFINAGLIDIHTIDDSIKVDLVDSDPDKNFFREDFYDGLQKAYLQKEVAQKLSSAQKLLKLNFPEYSLLVMDAAHPRHVSRLMYEKMKGTKFEKFVANPDKGSMHNFGIAVDITIVDANGKEIDMAFTPFYRGDLSIYWNYARFNIFGLSKAQKQNRRLLSDIMQKAGFIPLNYEWWHFDGIPKDEARNRYQIIE